MPHASAFFITTLCLHALSRHRSHDSTIFIRDWLPVRNHFKNDNRWPNFLS